MDGLTAVNALRAIMRDIGRNDVSDDELHRLAQRHLLGRLVPIVLIESELRRLHRDLGRAVASGHRVYLAEDHGALKLKIGWHGWGPSFGRPSRPPE